MKACNRKILELFYNAKHSGRISKPDAIGRVGEDDEGLVIELSWRVIGGVIADAKFRVFGNPNAIAITSLMTDNIIGKSVEDALLIGEDVIIDNLDEFRPEYLEVYDMVRECINEAYNNYLKRQSRKGDTEPTIDISEYQASIQEDNEESDIDLFKQLQKDLQGTNATTSKRGRPRKEIDETAIVEIGEKRGRGRPRKVVEETNEEQVETVKRGRGRPRKEVDETEVVEVGEKRGRGRPRKIVEETNEEQVETVKRGRGRPRKEVDETEVVEVGEKRGRGRPKKIVEESEQVEVGEKRGRGRPKKEVRYNFPSDLDEVINDEEVDQLINGNASKSSDYEDTLNASKLLDEDDDVFDADYDLFKSNIRNILSGKEVSEQHYGQKTIASEVENVTTTQSSDVNYFAQPIDEEEDSLTTSNEAEIVEENTQPQDIQTSEVEQPTFEATDNELYNEVESENANENVEQIKRGRGRPRKIVDKTEEEVGEKRGRGRPKKIVIEEVDDSESVHRGRGRPRLNPINSLTRSLAPSGMATHNTQDIVFASKNVTTTNININVTKTTTSVDDNSVTSNDYSHNTSISSTQQKVEVSIPNELKKDDEIEIEPNKLDATQKQSDDFDDEEDVDASFVKDEAPTGGIEDLLKALLDD